VGRTKCFPARQKIEHRITTDTAASVRSRKGILKNAAVFVCTGGMIVDYRMQSPRTVVPEVAGVQVECPFPHVFDLQRAVGGRVAG
jgi:hypothetical protein